MGRIGGPLGKSLGGAREALGGTLVQPFAAPRSLLHRRNRDPVPARFGPVWSVPGGRNGDARPGAFPFSGDIYMFNALFRQKARTNGRFPVCRRPVLVPMRIFSHRHENLFSWA